MFIERRDGLPGGSVAEGNLVLTCVFPILALLVVAGRFYSRRLKQMKPGLDDWLILVAMILHLAQMSMGILRDVKGGFGLPTKKLTFEQLKTQNQASDANNVFYPVVLTLARYSICVLVIKIFSVSSLRWAGYANIIFCTAWCIYCTLTGMLLCNPLAKAWHPEPNYPGHCGSQLPEIVKNAAWNIVCDLTTLALPVAGVWRLQLNRAHKWGLTAVFALGFVVIATAAARIGVTVVAMTRDVSPAYTMARTNLSFVETSLSIIVACAPTLRPLLTSAFHIYSPSGPSHHTPGASRMGLHNHQNSRKGFETLPDQYGFDEGERRRKHESDTGIPLYEMLTSTTRADGSPVPLDRSWSRSRDRDPNHITVTKDISISHNEV